MSSTQSYKNPLNNFGFKVTSKNDEDGLISEIFRRIPIKGNKIFVEFGAGNGLESNTLQLLFQDWQGIWVGNEDLAFKVTNECTLQYVRTHLDKVIFSNAIGFLKDNTEKNLSFLSMGENGNDSYYLADLLVLKPKVVCVKYNQSILPPGLYRTQYDDKNTWVHGDFYGTSLQNFVNILEGYKLLVCSEFGGSAFFVRDEYAELFPECPQNVMDVFVSPNKATRTPSTVIEHLITRNVK
jgi:hypothetical protein